MRADWTSGVCPALGTDCKIKKCSLCDHFFIFVCGAIFRPTASLWLARSERAKRTQLLSLSVSPRQSTDPANGWVSGGRPRRSTFYYKAGKSDKIKVSKNNRGIEYECNTSIYQRTQIKIYKRKSTTSH